MNVAKSERWSAFFDTTELWDKRILEERLAQTAKRMGAGLYVCELVIEERAFQRLRDFHKEYTRLQGAKARVQRYVKVDVGEPKGDNEMLGGFRKEERAALEKDSFLIIPTEGITPAEHAALLEYRDPLVEGKKGRGVPGGLNDAVILLSSMKYAQAQGLSKCLFVSNNTNDFSARLVQGLGRYYSGEWEFVTDAEAAILRLEQPDLAKAATEFMRANPDSVLSVLEKEKAKLWSDGFLLLAPRVQEIEAVTLEPPTDGAEVKLGFHATLKFVDRVAPTLSYVRAAVLYTGAFATSIFGESPQPVRLIEGEATGRYENGRFMGEPRILSVRPRGLEMSVAD